MNIEGHNSDTWLLFIVGNVLYILSIPIVSDIAPYISVCLMYLINKEKVDEAAMKVVASVKSIAKFIKDEIMKYIIK